MNIAAEIAKCRGVIAVQMLVLDKLSKLCDDNIGEHTKPGTTSDACICGTGDIKDANSICSILTCPIDLG